MNSPTRRRCQHCRRAFTADYRNAYHQRFCSASACQQASKQTSQRRWLRKPGNRDYFREPDNLDRVRQWRQAHPGYWRPARRCCERVGVPGSPELPEAEAIADLAAPEARTLQDFCRARTHALIELVSRLGRYALQEDIARCASQVVSEAQCILQRCQLNRPAPAQPCAVEVTFHESG